MHSPTASSPDCPPLAYSPSTQPYDLDSLPSGDQLQDILSGVDLSILDEDADWLLRQQGFASKEEAFIAFSSELGDQFSGSQQWPVLDWGNEVRRLESADGRVFPPQHAAESQPERRTGLLNTVTDGGLQDIHQFIRNEYSPPFSGHPPPEQNESCSAMNIDDPDLTPPSNESDPGSSPLLQQFPVRADGKVGIPALSRRPSPTEPAKVGCDKCDRTFARDDIRRRHLRDQHKSTIFACNHCPALKKRKDRMMDHCTEKHGDPKCFNEIDDPNART